MNISYMYTLRPQKRESMRGENQIKIVLTKFHTDTCVQKHVCLINPIMLLFIYFFLTFNQIKSI